MKNLIDLLSKKIAERDGFVIQANLEVAAFNGRIAQLQELIENENKQNEVDSSDNGHSESSVVGIPLPAEEG